VHSHHELELQLFIIGTHSERRVLPSFLSSTPEDSRYSLATDSSLRSLLDNAPDAVARFDRKLRHVYANLATARANNRPVEDFYLKTMRELGHSEEISSLLERHLLEVFATGAEQTFDVDFHGPHGRRYFECRMAPEFSQGVVETVIVFSRDLTDLKQAQQHLLESERTRAASRLAHELAHELNNPLQALRNTLFLLQTEAQEQREHQYLTLADATLARIESLARAILLLEGTNLVQHSDQAGRGSGERF
jgi:nitrogen-specific signal transduction histidine kinase